MANLTEKPHAGSFLLSIDDDGNLSRDNIVVAEGAGVLEAGAVLGKITASGKYVLRDAAAEDGSAVAAAVLFSRVDATNADAAGVGVTRHAEVRASGLLWKAGADAAAKASGLAELKAATVVPR